MQTASDHLAGKNMRCSCNTLTEKRFLKEAKEKHNNDYDFSNINYINSKTVIKFKCNECKQILEKTPIDILRTKKFVYKMWDTKYKKNNRAIYKRSKEKILNNNL